MPGSHSDEERKYTPTERRENGSRADLPPLSMSIIGVEPIDEFIREVADWVHGIIMSRPDVGGHIEVEAKLGMLMYRDGSGRLNYPVRVETGAHASLRPPAWAIIHGVGRRQCLQGTTTPSSRT